METVDAVLADVGKHIQLPLKLLLLFVKAVHHFQHAFVYVLKAAHLGLGAMQFEHPVKDTGALVQQPDNHFLRGRVPVQVAVEGLGLAQDFLFGGSEHFAECVRVGDFPNVAYHIKRDVPHQTTQLQVGEAVLAALGGKHLHQIPFAADNMVIIVAV